MMPSLSKVVEWLERKQEEFDKRFYAEVTKGNEVAVKDVLLYEQSLNEKKRGRVVTPPVKMRDMSKDMKWLSRVCV
jgi:hypothetical protein